MQEYLLKPNQQEPFLTIKKLNPTHEKTNFLIYCRYYFC